MSDPTFSWVASVLYIGGLIGIFIWNKTADKFGRKINGYLLSLTQILGWLGIILASNPTHLIIARFIMGLGGCGIISNCQLYISETTDNDMKGPLCALILISMNVGIVLVYLMGWLLSYSVLNLTSLFFPIIFLVLYFWLPETPLFLSSNGRHKEAEMAMKWYGLEEVGSEHELPDTQGHAKFKELFANAKITRITCIAMFLLIGQQMSGIGAIVSYSVHILSGTSLPANLSAIVVGFIQVIISCISGLVVKSSPRKPLLVYSYFGAFLSYLLICLYFILRNYNDSFILKCLPTLGVLCYIVVYNLGIGPLPFVILPEIFPARLLNHGISLSLVVLVISAFSVTKIFPALKMILGEFGVFLLFSCLNLIFGLLVLKFIWETKQRSKSEKKASALVIN